MGLLSRLAEQRNALALRRLRSRVQGKSAEIDPEPFTFGSASVASRLVRGEIRLAGEVIELTDDTAPFGLGGPAWEEEAQRFTWLDDLATLGTYDAAERAHRWTEVWLRRFGDGFGPGWHPATAADRLIRLISHYSFVRGIDGALGIRLRKSLRLHILYLVARAATLKSPEARARAEAAALIGALAIPGTLPTLMPLAQTLAGSAKRAITADGGLPSRNPEALMQLFLLLVTASTRLADAGTRPPAELQAAIAKIAPVLRLLRHADGGLARFNGGGAGPEGMLDRALAFSGVRHAVRSGDVAQGYTRLTAGRTSIIADTGKPPEPEHSAEAHASALAIELTSGRRPLIVSAGPGGDFGPGWALAARATPSHSTLSFAGLSQARIAAQGRSGPDGPVLLDHGPRLVHAKTDRIEDGTTLRAEHNAYVPTHGLWHVRQLRISLDGRQIEGEDTLEARSKDEQAIFKAAQSRRPDAFQFAIRFHLHPDVVADTALNGAAVSLKLKSGEVWLFRHDGTCDVSLEPSVWLTRDAAKPVPSEQIVLSATADEKTRAMRWTLSKAQDTPRGIRDLVRDEQIA